MTALSDKYLLVRNEAGTRKLKLVLDGEYLSYQTLVMHFPQATSLLFRNTETGPYNVIRFDFDKGRFVKPLQGWPKEAVVFEETGSNSNTIGFLQLHRDLQSIREQMVTKEEVKEIKDMLSWRIQVGGFLLACLSIVISMIVQAYSKK